MSQIEESRAQITWEPLPTLPVTEGLLAQVFQNLISNGIKYRQEEVAPEIHVSCKRCNSGYEFSVRDNGRGIAAEHQTKIFEPFTRLHGKGISGTGIGLATVMRSIERHGGRVWFESQPGEGSTFFFTLPVAEKVPLVAKHSA
jgi:signal transduction histidine kinase